MQEREYINRDRTMTHDDDDYPPMKPQHTGLRGKCPRCGQGELFSGFITVADRCSVCGLDYDFADAGDGPAFFVGFAAMAPVLAFALWMITSVGASYWLTAILSLILTGLLAVLPIRPLKGLLIAQQYVKRAGQGMLDG